MRRAWWLGAGYAAGLGTAAWLRNKARAAAERYTPANLRSVVAERSQQAAARARDTAAAGVHNLGREARRIVDDVRHAMAEGRETMQQTESELSDDGPVAAGGGGGGAPNADGGAASPAEPGDTAAAGDDRL